MIRQPYKWSCDKIVAALRDRQSRGLAMNPNAILMSDGRLKGAIRKYFHTHDAALKAAGIELATVWKWSRWDEARVIAALRARHEAGLGLGSAAIAREDWCLSGGIRRLFDSHDAALSAAGFDPKEVREQAYSNPARVGTPGRLKWDRDKIIAALRQRQASGLPLQAKKVQKAHPGLAHAIRRYIGSHDAALEAAGIDPASVRPRVSWDKERVVAALRARREAGLPINYQAIADQDQALRSAMIRIFGTGESALRAAGIDPKTVRLAKVYESEAEVIAGLRARSAKGAVMRPGNVAHDAPSLHHAACRHFRSYEAALEAAGIVVTWRKSRTWDRPTIVRELRDLAPSGSISNGKIRAADCRLMHAAWRHFGSVASAVKAAGLEYTGEQRRWDKPKVIEGLRKRVAGGLALNARAIMRSEPSLLRAIYNHVGSFGEALRAAGIDPGPVRMTRQWNKEIIIESLRKRLADGMAMNWMAIANSDPALLSTSRARFGSYASALRAAGIEPDRIRHHQHWDTTRIIEALRDRHARGLPSNAAAVTKSHRGLYYACRAHFGSYNAALRAAGIEPTSLRLPCPDEGAVLAALRAIANDGWISSKMVDYWRLNNAARKRFGTLAAAVKAAGLKYVHQREIVSSDRHEDY